MIPLLVATAAAGPIPLPELQARLAEVEPLRAARLGTNAPAIPDSAWPEVANGGVATGLVDADGTKARKIWGVGVVDVPIAAFFSAINDDQNKVDYTKLDVLRILDGELCGSPRTVFQHLPVPLLSDRWWVIEQRIHTELQAETKGRVREMVWRPAPSGVPDLPTDLRDLTAGEQHVTFTHGGWFLVDLGEERTLVEFWSWSDPGGNVPVRLAASMALGGIEDTFATMSDLARRGPACSL